MGSSPNGALSDTDQLVFYDPGIGAAAVKSTLLRRAWDAFCGATGIGLTPNIIDCYAAVIRLWCPGDRVFLFGFSRGAYTARGVGTVMRLCGVPVRAGDGTLLSQDKAQAREVATEAVKRLDQHVLSSREVAELTQQRDALAKLFREKYGADENGQPNAAPHFIGVFDTVSAIGGREFSQWHCPSF